MAAAALVVASSMVAFTPAATAVPLPTAVPTGFRDTLAIGGLSRPTAMAFAPDGRVFIGEKSGIVKVFDSLSDPTATVFADLRAQTHDFWDRGLLGLAVDPRFPARPYVYAHYTHDAVPGGTAPRWGDTCPTPPGATDKGCVVTSRLSKLTAGVGGTATAEQPLITDWCQQFPSHSAGGLAFGPDGALYAGGGDGASFNFTDYGQVGNPCADPPYPGASLTTPTARGGALRAQSLRRPAGEPASLDGTIIRVDPDNGAGLPDNPFAGSADANARRVTAYGMRNPFRFAFRPGTSELWAADVGWTNWEEIDRIPDARDATAENFGWPCDEGPGPQGGYDDAGLALCESLYAGGGQTAPYYTYNHSAKVVADDPCPTGGSSISGIAFESSSDYPSDYDGALFFADSSRGCIWAMRTTAGRPDPAKLVPFVTGANVPVQVVTGPGGDLFYLALGAGELRRVSYRGDARTAPAAVVTASGDSNATRVGAPVADDPVPVIDDPTAALRWVVGQQVPFSGHATDQQDGPLPASALSWRLSIQHCSTGGSCHEHVVQDYPGVSSGSFVAPDHGHPSHLVLTLTATDSSGRAASTEVRLDPRTVDLAFSSRPSGLRLSVGATTSTTPFSRTVIVGSANSVSAPSPQADQRGVRFEFVGWSDGGAQTHQVVAPADPAAYRAVFGVCPTC